MSTTQKRILLLIVLLNLLLLAAAIGRNTSRGDGPALIAQRIEQQLFTAQQALARDPAAARSGVEAATARHRADLAPLLPPSAALAAQAALQALADAQAAAAAGAPVALAQARADYKTALLWGGYLATLSSIRVGDGASAAVWIKLRDFKPSAPLDPASSGATLALQELAAGRLNAEGAGATVRAELDETYRALMEDALWETAVAANRQFGMRAAEEAALAVGYFRIIRSTFAEQAGTQRAAAADQALAALHAAAAAADWPAVQREHTALRQLFGP